MMVWLKPAWIGVWFAAVYLLGNGVVFHFLGSRFSAPLSYVTAWPFSVLSAELAERFGHFFLLNAAFWYLVGHILYHWCRIAGGGVPSRAVLFMLFYLVVLGGVFVM